MYEQRYKLVIHCPITFWKRLGDDEYGDSLGFAWPVVIIGDYVLIGESTEPDPLEAGADEVMQVIQYADTFERTADDYAILAGI